jgi:hypothetical protein
LWRVSQSVKEERRERLSVTCSQLHTLCHLNSTGQMSEGAIVAAQRILPSLVVLVQQNGTGQGIRIVRRRNSLQQQW